MEAQSYCLEQGALSATDGQYMTDLLFGYLDSFEEMDQLYTVYRVIHLFAPYLGCRWLFINGIGKLSYV